MSGWHQDLTVRGKIALTLALAVGISLLMAVSVVVTAKIMAARAHTTEDIESFAGIIAVHSAASVVSRDKAGMEATLRALSANHGVTAAWILDANYAPLATYLRTGATQAPLLPARETGVRYDSRFFPHSATLAVPIFKGRETAGYVAMHVDLDKMWREIMFVVTVIFLVALLIFACAYWAVARIARSITNPVMELAHTARRVAEEKKYNLRVRQAGSDELGVLSRDFNGMLREIEERDQDLIQHRTRLQEEVDRYSVELRAAKDLAERASTAKMNFLANMSHEIRTPLNGVLGMIELLGDSPLDRGQQRFLSGARDSAEALMRIINDVLDLSKLEAGKFTVERIPFSVRHVIEQTVGVFDEAANRKSLILRQAIEADVPAAMLGDPHRVRQIVSNLIGNAIKFTERGEVRVLCSVERTGNQSRQLRISVIDTGMGIDEAALRRLFQPFTQVDDSTTRKFGGTGLGLAIVRQLVQLMGGDAAAASTPGRGSTFWVTIPLEEAAVRAEAADDPLFKTQPSLPVGTQTARAAGAKVLLVDDNEVNRMIALEMMRVAGYDAIAAENGFEAVEAFKTDNYTIVLMDCHMPVMDGFEATAAIREYEAANRGRYPAGTPVVALTANALEGYRDRCIAAGMSDYLAKPFTRGALIGCLAKWSATARSPQGFTGQAPAAVSGESVTMIDESVLSTLRASLGDDDAVMKQLIDMFLADAPKLVGSAKAALASGNQETLTRSAHSLKSTSATMGATQVSASAKELEVLARAANFAEAAGALDRLEAQLEGAVAVLRQKIA